MIHHKDTKGTKVFSFCVSKVHGIIDAMNDAFFIVDTSHLTIPHVSLDPFRITTRQTDTADRSAITIPLCALCVFVVDTYLPS